MQLMKRMILFFTIIIIFASGSILTSAQSNSEALKTIKEKLEHKDKEKQSINSEIENVKKEIEEFNSHISGIKEKMDNTLKEIETTNERIEEKKEEIIVLEDNILARKDVMEKRLIALQHDDNFSIVMKVLIEAKSFEDFIQRTSAVTTLLNADKELLNAQKNDLEQIEEDKKEVETQKEILKEQQLLLAEQEADLNESIQKKQESLAGLEEKYNQIDNQIALAKEEKSGIEAQIKAAQDKLLREQEEAKRRSAQAPNDSSQNSSQPVGKGEEKYVVATAYSPEESGAITASGYNIRANPNMKLIAVDPSVIPLGSKVWVEGYGEAIAGDTGSAIVGHKIDVLLPTRNQAIIWGRKVVKIIILD